MFQGAYTALITPFKENYELDEQALVNIINFQIENGIHGLVPCGTTGETPTLTFEEYKRVIELTVQTANDEVPIIAGAGSNCTTSAIKYAKAAEELGANAVLIVAPYYNKPNQEGLYQHFEAINNSINIPIFLYDNPARTIVSISDETIIRLSHLTNVIGLKDSSGNMARPSKLRGLIEKDFYLFSGDDACALSYNAQGGIGCISVAANIVPDLCSNLQNLWAAGEFKSALELQTMLTSLYEALFCEVNPVPVKYAASILKLCSSTLRLPLVQSSENNKKRIEEMINSIL